MKQNKETLKQFFETGDKPTQQQYADLIDSYIDAKQPEGEANRRFVIDELGEVSVASEQQVPEYTLSPISGTNTVDLLKDGVGVSQIDLTPYLDNTNLARLVSGTVDANGLATFTRDDNSTFTVDLSNLKDTVPQYQAGTNITIDNTNPLQPIINSTGDVSTDISGLVPYTGATQNVVLGDNLLSGGKETTITNKNIHNIVLSSDGIPILRVQKSVWNGSTYLSDSFPRSIAVGQDALLNNTGSSVTAFGYLSLKNNTGSFGAGFGISALESNTGINSSGFGQNSLRNNTGDNASGFGTGTLFSNTGNFVAAVGTSAGSFNTGSNSTMAGYWSARFNTGNEINSYGYLSAENNTGSDINAYGAYAMRANTGNDSNGYGSRALSSNTGNFATGIGDFVMSSNNGDDVSGVGRESLQYNHGNNTTGLGSKSLKYNVRSNNSSLGVDSGIYMQGSDNTSLGYKSWSEFNEDIANSKDLVDVTIDVNVSLNQITIPSHGFGSVNELVILKYTISSGSSGIGGVPRSSVSVFVPAVFKIIDVNTIESVGFSITSQGSLSGTHTFTPQYDYNNTTVIGANANPTKSNQIVLGDDNILEVSTNGDYVSTNEGKGLILKTPDGTKQYRISIDNSGNIVTTLI